MINQYLLRWANFGKLFLLLVLCSLVSHIRADSDTSEQLQDMDHVEEPSIQKRSWKNLQGGWGKRGPTNEQPEPNADGYGYPQSNAELDKLNKLLAQEIVNQLLVQSNTQYDDADYGYPAEKRAWNKMNAGWGKRVNAGPAQWNKFRGAWGKREPGWNNLKGLWGKRSAQWNKLSSSWGKRDSGNSISY